LFYIFSAERPCQSVTPRHPRLHFQHSSSIEDVIRCLTGDLLLNVHTGPTINFANCPDLTFHRAPNRDLAHSLFGYVLRLRGFISVSGTSVLLRLSLSSQELMSIARFVCQGRRSGNELTLAFRLLRRCCVPCKSLGLSSGLVVIVSRQPSLDFLRVSSRIL
jgi:hypothetical protein